MSPFSRRLLGLCLAPVLVWSVDCTLTLCGQSEAYWAGIGTRHIDGINALHNYGSSVNEVSPTSRMLLLCSLIMLLPGTLALVTCVAATLGHTWGATTWLSRLHYG